MSIITARNLRLADKREVTLVVKDHAVNAGDVDNNLAIVINPQSRVGYNDTKREENGVSIRAFESGSQISQVSVPLDDSELTPRIHRAVNRKLRAAIRILGS